MANLEYSSFALILHNRKNVLNWSTNYWQEVIQSQENLTEILTQPCISYSHLEIPGHFWSCYVIHALQILGFFNNFLGDSPCASNLSLINTTENFLRNINITKNSQLPCICDIYVSSPALSSEEFHNSNFIETLKFCCVVPFVSCLPSAIKLLHSHF